jgi:aspartate ammonia-lyase
VRIASICLLKSVTELFAALQTALQEKEQEFTSVLKVGRTQLQDAVPVTLGQEFGAWAQAIARDRWRLTSGSASVRSITAEPPLAQDQRSRAYIFTMIESFVVTGNRLARAEYKMDPTQNAMFSSKCLAY